MLSGRCELRSASLKYFLTQFCDPASAASRRSRPDRVPHDSAHLSSLSELYSPAVGRAREIPGEIEQGVKLGPKDWSEMGQIKNFFRSDFRTFGTDLTQFVPEYEISEIDSETFKHFD